MSNPKISFVMPCWNAGFIFNQTIDSLFSQTEEDFEVIIINDGSTDDTFKLMNEINDPRFICINLPERKGAGNARNIGNGKARLSIISVTDCGDIMYPNRAEEVIAYFNNNPSIDIMCAKTDSCAGGETNVPKLYTGAPGEKLRFEHSGVSYRKRVPDTIKYRTTSIHTDQYDAFFFEAFRAGFTFGVYENSLTANCTFGEHPGGRNLSEALLVKASIYTEFGVPLPEWLDHHVKTYKPKQN